MSIITPSIPTLLDAQGRPLVRLKMVKNPMLEYPRNWKCWCGANKQAKKCCLPKMTPVIPERDAEIGLSYMAYVKENYGKQTEVKDEPDYTIH
jgi:hypothetical protein